MKLGFASDIHLDHVSEVVHIDPSQKVKSYPKHRRVGARIAQGLDVLVLGGDLATGNSLGSHMKAFIEGAGIPVYFVLGNHDFWGAPEEQVKSEARKLGGYLDELGVVE